MERLKELVMQTDMNEDICNIPILEVVDSLVASLYCTKCPIKQQCKEASLKCKNNTCKDMLLLYINGTIQKDGEE